MNFSFLFIFLSIFLVSIANAATVRRTGSGQRRRVVAPQITEEEIHMVSDRELEPSPREVVREEFKSEIQASTRRVQELLAREATLNNRLQELVKRIDSLLENETELAIRKQDLERNIKTLEGRLVQLKEEPEVTVAQPEIPSPTPEIQSPTPEAKPKGRKQRRNRVKSRRVVLKRRPTEVTPIPQVSEKQLSAAVDTTDVDYELLHEENLQRKEEIETKNLEEGLKHEAEGIQLIQSQANDHELVNQQKEDLIRQQEEERLRLEEERLLEEELRIEEELLRQNQGGQPNPVSK